MFTTLSHHADRMNWPMVRVGVLGALSISALIWIGLCWLLPQMVVYTLLITPYVLTLALFCWRRTQASPPSLMALEPAQLSSGYPAGIHISQR